MKICTCGTMFDLDSRTSYSGAWTDSTGNCPTCQLAKKLGFEIKHDYGGYDDNSLEWVPLTDTEEDTNDIPRT